MYYLNPELVKFIPVAALVVPLLVWLNYRRKKALQEVFGDRTLLSKTSKPLSRTRYFLRGVLTTAAACLILAALCRPILNRGEKTIAEGTLDVIAVIDVSRSMAAMDYDGKVPQSAVAKRLIEVPRKRNMLVLPGREPEDDEPTTAPAPKDLKQGVEDTGTRLEMVRHILQDYMVKTLDGNHLGLVSYAGESFPQAFLTKDTRALQWIIDRSLTISSAPGEGSAMGKALLLSLAMFDADSPAEHERLLILFSDGGNDDKPEVLVEFARQAKSRGIKVIVVAMGNVMPSKIPVSKLAPDDDVAIALKANGKRWLETEGQIEKSGMNAALLQNLANQSGGQFIHLQNMSDLNLLDHVGKKATAKSVGSIELFPWLIGLALVSLVLSITVTHQWRRRNGS